MNTDFLKKVFHARGMGRLGFVYRPTVKEKYGFTQEE